MTADDTPIASPAQAPAVYFDGTTNRRHRVALRFENAVEIVEDGTVVANWPYDAIRRVDGPSGRLRLGCTAALPLARLDVEDEMATAALIARCTHLDVDRPTPGQAWRIVAWSLGAVCSILLVAIYGIPLAAERLTPLVPDAVERRIGEAVDTQVHQIFRSRICTRPEGVAAFNTMIEKLKAAGRLDRSLNARVLSHQLPNAFALPGGNVYLMNGLLEFARSPDEIAGVLAHELGHVQHRDVLRLLIQNGGTSFLIGLLLGDVLGGSAVIFATRNMLDASYSREAEQNADDFAIATMQSLGRSAVPMGEFLLRITGEQKKRSIAILNSHPLTENRLATMKAQDRPITGPDILTADEWRALKEICGTD